MHTCAPVLMSTNTHAQATMSRMLCPSWVMVKGSCSVFFFFFFPYWNVVLVMSQVGHAMELWSELYFGPVHWSAGAGWFWEGLGSTL